VASKHKSKSSTVANVSERLFDEIPSIGTGNDLNLVVELRLNALELRLDIGMFLRKSSESRQDSESLGFLILAEQKPWSLRSEEGTDAPYQSRDELKRCGELPLEVCSSVVLCHAVVEEEAEYNTKLLAACVLKGQETSNRLGGNLKRYFGQFRIGLEF
jgi:hypothetical protein